MSSGEGQDPFGTRHEIPVAGGRLSVAAAGPPVGGAERVILLVHGITASHVAWIAVTRALIADGSTSVLAADLRGRGASAALPGPFGSAAHAEDLLAVLDHLEVPRVVLGGHSMGAFVAARLAAEHPQRVSSLVLVDGGLSIPVPGDADPDELLARSLGPALERLGQIYETREDYVQMWRRHPAFVNSWNADVHSYAGYDLTPADGTHSPEAVRSVVSADAVWNDGRELLVHEPTRTVANRVVTPLRLLRAPRGMFDDDRPMIPQEVLDEFLTARPDAGAETVPDTNHYTILLGESPGPARVAEAFRSAVLAA